MIKDLPFYLKLPYAIVVTPGEDEEDGWLAEIPDLPGCFTAGDTKEEALEMIEDAKVAWLTHAFAKGYPIPEPQWALHSSK